MTVNEIIVVDDCSTDDTELVLRDLMTRESRLKYFKLPKNEGHLTALMFGAREATSDWVALLDADDELTSNSIEARVGAALEYQEETGTKPELIYGDHFVEPGGARKHYIRLKGYAFPFLSRELCLCQTSTMMLGKECLPYFPVSKNPWNTDDEIVLAIGKHFDVLHSGAYVSVYHMHNSPTKMSSSAKKMCQGVRQLVIDHQDDIFRHHGMFYVLLWRLRIVRAFVRYQIQKANSRIDLMAGGWGRNCWRAYRKFLVYFEVTLNSLLRNYFVLDYF